MNEIEALVILTHTQGLGPVKIRHLIQTFGSACQVLNQSRDSIAQLSGFHAVSLHWNWWEKDLSWKEVLTLSQLHGIQLVSYLDPHYPKAFLDLNDYPLLLYIRGSLSALTHIGIAIVGTRNASVYGKEMAFYLAHQLSFHQMAVISGLARGIDTAAHEGALKNGATIAIIGSGHLNLYPKENAKLAESICEKGVIISEYPPLAAPHRSHFPMRNRLVAKLSQGIVLVEAPEQSGAILTMQRGLNYQKKLYAIPGRADHENFRGNHAWIKTGQAQLIEKAEDILKDFDNSSLFTTSAHCPKPLTLSQEETWLLQCLPLQEVSLEEIERTTKISIKKLNILLMSLVIKKLIKEYPGKLYKKISS